MNRIAMLLCLLGAVCIVGCAGTGTNNRVTFSNSLYPVSLSPVVVDSDGTILGPDRLESLGTFQGRKRGWSTIWGFVSLHDIDFSEELNAEVQRLGGEAVVDLQITSINSGLNWWIILNWIPIWPGHVKVEVKGTVVRRLGSLREAIPSEETEASWP